MSAANLVDKTISLPKKTKNKSVTVTDINPIAISNGDSEIDATYLKQLKTFLRTDPSQSKDVIRHIILCLKKRNKVVALRGLIVLNILFERSHHCRNEIETSIQDIATNCGICISPNGTSKRKVISRKRKRSKFSRNMSVSVVAPTHATVGIDILMKQCILIFNSWDTMFKNDNNCNNNGADSVNTVNTIPYPNIHTMVRFINEKYKILTDSKDNDIDHSHLSIQVYI